MLVMGIVFVRKANRAANGPVQEGVGRWLR